MGKQSIYRVIFQNRGQTYEVYARSVSQGDLFGFIQVETLLYGERSQVVLDPSEESLKAEFKGVSRFSVPLHAVIRIDEVEKQGVGRITKNTGDTGTVAAFPAPFLPGPGKSGKDSGST
ncbi:MAG: DUF1820 family protein [Acidobacteriota bacterium]